MKKKQIVIISILFTSFFNASAQNWDIDITKDINPVNPNSGYWKTTSGSVYFICAAIPVGMLASGLIKDDANLRKKSYELFGAVAVELVISETMKLGFNRRRPAEKYPSYVFPYRNINGRSFPSGHTSLAFATAASLAIECRKWYVTVPAFLWASSVGYSRIYLGVHYASDVLAGAAVGIGSAYLAHFINQKLFQNDKRSGRNKRKNKIMDSVSFSDPM